jgi:pyruvate dehydrogenase E1 component
VIDVAPGQQTGTPVAITPERLAVLDAIQRRILWLATFMVHHANHVRPNPDGTKIGGHQASSTSLVTILTALYFHFLRPGDRVSIKPHASPAFHAVQYLLGQLPRQYLATLRAYGGLQAYPSRTKDPDDVDFSTGSVGLGRLRLHLRHWRIVTRNFTSVTSHRDALLRWWAMQNWTRAMCGRRSSMRRWKVWTT